MRFLVLSFVGGVLLFLAGCQVQNLHGEGPITLTPRVSALYSAYMKKPVPLVFAVSTDGQYGSYVYCPDSVCQSASKGRVIRSCEKSSKGVPCKIYAIRKKVVWKGEVGNGDISSVEIKMTLLRNNLKQDPANFNGGAVIYMPGYNHYKPISVSNKNVPPYLLDNRFADWHIYKLFTVHEHRTTLALDKQIESLRKLVVGLKEKGFKRVVVTGQSAGGWMALKAAADIPEVDGILAATPSKYGSKTNDKGSNNNLFNQSTDATLQLLRKIKNKQVVLAFFKGDPWEPTERGREVEAALGDTDLPHIVINHPKGIYGHHGAWSKAFTEMYTECLNNFFMGQQIEEGSCRKEGIETAEYDTGDIDLSKIPNKEMRLSSEAYKAFKEIYWPKPVLEDGTYAYKFFAYSPGAGVWGWGRSSGGDKPRWRAFTKAMDSCSSRAGDFGCKIYAIDNRVVGSQS